VPPLENEAAEGAAAPREESNRQRRRRRRRRCRQRGGGKGEEQASEQQTGQGAWHALLGPRPAPEVCCTRLLLQLAGVNRAGRAIQPTSQAG
jgi:hypothetical protein